MRSSSTGWVPTLLWGLAAPIPSQGGLRVVFLSARAGQLRFGLWSLLVLQVDQRLLRQEQEQDQLFPTYVRWGFRRRATAVGVTVRCLRRFGSPAYVQDKAPPAMRITLGDCEDKQHRTIW